MNKENPKLVLNDTAVATPTLLSNQFSVLKIAFNADEAKVRHDTMEGRDYLVVPCVMLTEGVHNGSLGPLYYPEEELAKTPVSWNAKPVVVYHPQLNGQAITACDPDIFDKQKIGVLMNTKWDDGKLKTECWIEEDKANEVDDRVLNAIEEGTMMEVSTGLFTDNEATEGEWNGEAYKAIARNFRPDHLAILPDLEGSCSIEDGAGLLRNEAEKNGPEAQLAQSLVAVFNELSHDDIWKELNDKIRGGVMSDAWVSQVWDDFFIYEADGDTYYQEYEIVDDEVRLVGIRQAAEKVVQYELSDGTVVGNTDLTGNNLVAGTILVKNTFLKESAMKKKEKQKLVDSIIANEKSPWSEEDREALMGMTDNKLDYLVDGEEKPAENTTPKEEGKIDEAPAPAADPPKADETPAENKEVTVDEYIENAPEGMRDVLRSGVKSHAVEKQKLIGKITANERNTFTADQLSLKSIEELTQLATLAAVPEAAPVVPAAHFGGQAPTAPVDNEDEEEPLTVPSTVNAEDE